jgi:hypothetical protein
LALADTMSQESPYHAAPDLISLFVPGPIRPRYTKAALAAATLKPFSFTWRCPVCDVRWRSIEAENECWSCPRPTAGVKLYEYPSMAL